jgi:uncharacterized protein (TIGR03067 family)
MGLWSWLGSLANPLVRLWRRLRDGSGLDVEELARRLGLPAERLETASTDYQQKTIPKRSGGTRLLSVPAAELKELQRRLLRRLLARLKCHPAAKGFQPGQSIVTNALPHAAQAVVVRLDIRDFFPATTSKRVYGYFRRVGWNRPASALLTRLCTHAGGLPQGAPTSPRLSNLVNFRLDRRIAAMAQKLGARYTRYADDITLSFPADERERIRYLIRFVRRVAAEEGYRLHGRKKLRIRRQHQQQRVTGLVVNAGVRLPRRTRRLLRAVQHHLDTGRPATLTPQQLAGWRAFADMVARQGGAPKRAAAPAPDPGRQLLGDWALLGVDDAGRAALAGAAPEGPAVVWAFTSEMVRIEKDGQVEWAAYTLDVSARPYAITLTPTAGPDAGKPVEGIYAREGDFLTICLREPGQGRPAGFAGGPGSGQVVFRFRAVREPPALPGQGNNYSI